MIQPYPGLEPIYFNPRVPPGPNVIKPHPGLLVMAIKFFVLKLKKLFPLISS